MRTLSKSCAVALFIAIATTSPLLAQSAASAPLSAVSDEAFRTWLDRTDLGRMIRRDQSALRTVKTADGTEAVVMDGGFQSVLVAYTDESGEAVTTCINTSDAAKAIFATDRAPRTRKAE